MGSLTSSPKVPSPRIVQVPAPQSTTDIEDGPNAEELAAEQREKNLLSRKRGRLGTIATGFRGFLGENAEATTRKTLLGE